MIAQNLTGSILTTLAATGRFVLAILLVTSAFQRHRGLVIGAL
ncbi:Uncharacterised protein [Escherichia coli]|uniref:Uncharacterized protein n=1 Tax=Escherichia coli TaxID=562 RepID=A0A2X3KEL5_ECOLX|nr:Uncharacterised protein [Escherichia coli]